MQHVISVIPLEEKLQTILTPWKPLRCRFPSPDYCKLTHILLLSVEQTEDLKEIALKISKLPKVNKSRPRTVVITHGKEPAIVVKGTSKHFLLFTCPCSFISPAQVAYTQIHILFPPPLEEEITKDRTNPNSFKNQFILIGEARA